MVALEPAQPLRPLLVVRLGLGPLGDATHRGHHQRRIDPDRGLGRQHHGVGAVEHGVGDVADLGAGRRRGRHHRLQHLRGRDHRDAELDALPHDRLLQVRHVLERAVDPEVAPGDHDRIRHGEDLGEVPERRARLDLGDELGAIADDLAYRRHVGGGAHERHGDELDAGRRHRLGEHQILVGRRREPRPLRGQVDAGAALCAPAVLDHGDAPTSARRAGPGRDRPIADDHSIADGQVVEEAGVVDADHVGVARPVADLEADHRSRLQLDARRRERSRADLRSREVGQHPDRLADRDRDRPHAFETVDVLRDGAVAEVETHHVDTGATRATSASSPSVAGPSVATIFVRRVTPGAPGASSGGSHLLI